MKNLYFGHPVNVYHTELERLLLAKIDVRFPDWHIVNPSDPGHEHEYQEWTRLCGNGMEYFFRHVLPGCQGGIFLPFRDGKWGKGVFGEALWLSQRKLPIWRIDPADFSVIPASTMLVSSAGLVLTKEETRERIRDSLGRSLPF